MPTPTMTERQIAATAARSTRSRREPERAGAVLPKPIPTATLGLTASMRFRRRRALVRRAVVNPPAAQQAPAVKDRRRVELPVLPVLTPPTKPAPQALGLKEAPAVVAARRPTQATQRAR